MHDELIKFPLLEDSERMIKTIVLFSFKIIDFPIFSHEKESTKHRRDTAQVSNKRRYME